MMSKKRIILFVLFAGVGFVTFNYNILSFLYPSKIWAHRVNSIQKFQETSKKFKGVELDVVFDISKNSFDVNHPPAKSINLTLLNLLKTKKNYQNFRIWLDFKNLGKINCEKSLKRLVYIVKELNIPTENIIVESHYPAYLKPFLDKGFKTSYYLPSNIKSFSDEAIKKQVSLIEKLKKSNSINFISSYSRDYEFIKEKLPKGDIILWNMNVSNDIYKNLTHPLSSIKNFIVSLYILKDENVKVLLVSFKAKKGNR